MGQARGSFSHLRQEAEERAERHGANGSLIDRQGAHTACQLYPGYFKSVHLAFLRPLGRCLWTALARNLGLCEQVSACRLGPEDVGQISRAGTPLSCGKVRVRKDRHAPHPYPRIIAPEPPSSKTAPPHVSHHILTRMLQLWPFTGFVVQSPGLNPLSALPSQCLQATLPLRAAVSAE